jgi:hypothetical protein
MAEGEQETESLLVLIKYRKFPKASPFISDSRPTYFNTLENYVLLNSALKFN